MRNEMDTRFDLFKIRAMQMLGIVILTLQISVMLNFIGCDEGSSTLRAMDAPPA